MPTTAVFLFLGATLLLLTGCASSTLLTVPPEHYGRIDGDPIIVTTKDSIQLSPSDSASGVSVDVLLEATSVTKASAVGDSLHFQLSRFYGTVPFSRIDSIQFYGIIDPQLGLIPDRELMAHSPDEASDYGFRIAAAAGGAVFLLTALLDPFEDSSLDEGSSKAARWSTVAISAGVGFLLGRNYGERRDREKALEIMRDQRQAEQ